MTRVYNFSAGPACLPEWVLKKAASEMLDAHNSGMSVMEMSHRSSEFQDIIDTCKARLKRLMNIPDEYDIKVSKLIPCKWHKKKRINKKMLKKHGHPNYVHKFETVKGWRLHSYTNGEIEFVKDGDKL